MIIYIILFSFLRNHQSNILLSSFLAIPQAFLALVFIPETWNPKRIFVFGIGPEDIIFSFLFGGLAWMTGLFFFRKQVIINIRQALLIKRFLIFSVYGVIVGGILLKIGIGVYSATFIAMVIWCAILIYFHKDFLLFAFYSSLFLGLIYFIGLQIALFFWPQLPALWNWENLWDIDILRLPLEEIIFPFLYGPVWSLTMIYLIGAKVVKKTGQS